MQSVTILIPCFNEATVIEEKIRNCLSLRTDGADVEVLVVDDYSTDKTSAIARTTGVRVVRSQETRGKWGAITTGASIARHEVLCITDADVLLGKQALVRALPYLDSPGVGAVCGVRRMITKRVNGVRANADGLYDVVRKAMVVFYSLLDSSPALYGPMMLVRRELIGRIDGGRLRADDVDLPVQIRKLGLKAKVCPSAWFWELELTDAAHDEQASRRALGLAQAYWRHRDAFFNPRLGAFGLVAYPMEFTFFLLSPWIALALCVAAFVAAILGNGLGMLICGLLYAEELLSFVAGRAGAVAMNWQMLRSTLQYMLGTATVEGLWHPPRAR